MGTPARTHIGLTGGVGSGKSTVAALLAKLGACVIDADAISRRTTAAGGAAMADIERAFGPRVIAADGSLDRPVMRELVFRNPDARARLEAIVHPLVRHETERQTQAAHDAGCRCIVFDVPLLVESAHWRGRLDRVLVVDCTAATQIERTMRRDGLSHDAVQGIVNAQSSRPARLRAADMVIFNDGLSLAALGAQVRQAAACFGL